MNRKFFNGLDFPVMDLYHATSFFKEELYGEGIAVHFINSYTISLAFSQPKLLEVLKRGILVPDGTPLARFLSIYTPCISQIRGPDFMREFLLQSDEKMSHFFLGSTFNVVSDLIENVLLTNEKLNIAGYHCPEKVVDYSTHIEEWVQIIEKSRARYVWVGLGTPKQDYVVHELSKVLPTICFAVGAAFDYLSGNLKEAPKAIQNSGFEWAYRLKEEPSRLWKRYLMGNLHFILICVREFFRQRN